MGERHGAPLPPPCLLMVTWKHTEQAQAHCPTQRHTRECQHIFRVTHSHPTHPAPHNWTSLFPRHTQSHTATSCLQTHTVTQPSTQSPIHSPTFKYMYSCSFAGTQSEKGTVSPTHPTPPTPSPPHTHFSETFSDAEAYFQLHYHPPGVACTHSTLKSHKSIYSQLHSRLFMHPLNTD